MVPFNFQLEFNARQITFSAEQLDQLADAAGFMRYRVRTFNDSSIVFVNTEDAHLAPANVAGYSLDEAFTLEQVHAIAQAVREHNSSRKLNFDQMAFDF